jgi:hypothetical protein
MKVPLFTFASLENQLIAAMIIYLGQSRSRVIAPTYQPARRGMAQGSFGSCRLRAALRRRKIAARHLGAELIVRKMPTIG